MKHWGLSVIAGSPLLAGVYAVELQQSMKTGRMLSQATFSACSAVAAYTPAQEAPSLAIVHSEGAPPRRVYLRYPELNEWPRLERGSLTAEDAGPDILWHIVVDALH
jgi:hypothetical protein